MRFIISGIFMAASLLSAPLQAQEAASNNSTATDPAAEKLWQEVMDAVKPPPPPADWQGAPTPEQQEAFKSVLAEKAGVAADKAREFYTKYPDHPKAEEAQQREKMMLGQAIRFGATDRVKQLEKSPALTEEEKFEAEVNELNRRAMAKEPEGMEAMLDELAKGARELMKKYPDRMETWGLLLLVASNSSDDEKARALLEEIRTSESAPALVKARAEAALKTKEALGKPLDISFTSLDGRKIDLQEMDGKVVLIDFWATWCGPCIKELPNVKSAYEKLHPKGFEILGISFDNKKETLEKFVKEENMPWPQFFDEEREFGERFNIEGIPTMWLVDKKGNLRDLNARSDLESKVEKLLAEK